MPSQPTTIFLNTPTEAELFALYQEHKRVAARDWFDREVLRKLLLECWSRETAHPLYQLTWKTPNRGEGQSDVTALLAHELLGGTIMQTRKSVDIPFYVNRLPVVDGVAYFDLTTRIPHVKQLTLTDAEVLSMNRYTIEVRGKESQLSERYDRLRNAVFNLMTKSVS